MGTKAQQAARQQAAKRQADGQGFDETKLDIIHEEEPVDVGRHGVIGVEIYSYNKCTPRIGVYRHGLSKDQKPWKVKALCPLTNDQAKALGRALTRASKKLAEMQAEEE